MAFGLFPRTIRKISNTQRPALKRSFCRNKMLGNMNTPAGQILVSVSDAETIIAGEQKSIIATFKLVLPTEEMFTYSTYLHLIQWEMFPLNLQAKDPGNPRMCFPETLCSSQCELHPPSSHCDVTEQNLQRPNSGMFVSALMISMLLVPRIQRAEMRLGHCCCCSPEPTSSLLFHLTSPVIFMVSVVDNDVPQTVFSFPNQFCAK